MHDLFTRREFVHKGLGLIGLCGTVPTFLSRTVWAMTDPTDVPLTRSKPGVPDDRVLVVIQLAGGNDGLNTIVPYRHDLYYRARRRIAIAPQDTLRLDDEFALHPAATGLKTLYDEGLLAIVQGAGYPNPNRSHFVSTDIWESADPKRRTYSGWVGRYFDNCCRGSATADSNLGLALTQQSPLAMVGEEFSPVTFTDPNRLRWRGHRSNPGGEAVFARLNRPREDDHDPDGSPRRVSALDYIRRSALDARVSADEIHRAVENEGRGPGDLTGQLATVARMIASDLPTKVYYLSLGGFDTHSDQVGRQQRLLTRLGDGLSSFFATLDQMGLADRVALMTFSEFGRRVSENGSGGTDHGTAAPMFVAGASIKPGLHGQHPRLDHLDDNGDLIHTTDFRSVYAAVLREWLGVNPEKILRGQFAKMSLFKT